MRRNLIQTLFILTLTAAFLVPQGGTSLCCPAEQDHSTAAPESSVPTQQDVFSSSSEKAPVSSHASEGFRTLHCSSCHHGTFAANRFAGTDLGMSLAESEFLEMRPSIKPSPSLDGPFQPPRAA